MDSLRGKLLLASPTMTDPNFARSVVLIAEHTEEGAMGLVLNRPAETTVAATAPETAPEPDPAESPDEDRQQARDSEALLTPEERKDLQTALQWFGYYPAAIDGAFGPGTRNSMSAWQEARGYEPTGILTTRQRRILLEDWRGEIAAFGFRVNHFTVDAGRLRTLDGLRAVNALVAEAGFELNREGGLIKGSPADRLEQSSTRADAIDVAFEDGTFRVPSCYYEFALRHALPTGELFQGFVPASADKLFHSTDARRDP